MYFIKKRKEPTSLTKYRSGDDASYDNLPSKAKEDIKNQLLDEQGNTCAYCMQSIKFDSMKVEHWYPQSEDDSKESTLNYNNLLGCCEGNEKAGNKEDVHTCDTKKANKKIKFSPSNPSHQINNKIIYSKSGKISSTDLEFNRHINDHLNLNLDVMVDNRNAALNSIKETLNSISKDRRSKAKIESLLIKVSSKSKRNSYIPFYGAAIDYLSKKLR